MKQPVAWMLEMTEGGYEYTCPLTMKKKTAETWLRREVFLHNAIADYGNYPDVRVTPLFAMPEAK